MGDRSDILSPSRNTRANLTDYTEKYKENPLSTWIYSEMYLKDFYTYTNESEYGAISATAAMVGGEKKDDVVID